MSRHRHLRPPRALGLRMTKKELGDWRSSKHGSRSKLLRKNESRKKLKLLVDQETSWKRLIESLDYPQPLVHPSLLPRKALMPPQLHMLGNSIRRPSPRMPLRPPLLLQFWGMMWLFRPLPKLRVPRQPGCKIAKLQATPPLQVCLSHFLECTLDAYAMY
jgi:hypothetical protein